jgi:hypothetical protein
MADKCMIPPPLSQLVTACWGSGKNPGGTSRCATDLLIGLLTGGEGIEIAVANLLWDLVHTMKSIFSPTNLSLGELK